MNLHIDGQVVTLAELRAVWAEPARITLGDNARIGISASAAQIQKVVAGGNSVYGVNTGFGQLAQVRISNDDLVKLQENLVRSHAVGVGALLPDAIVRLIMVMKVVALAQGYSGVREELVDALCGLINNDIYPSIPAKGSVGASGDLAPLAHMSGALLGIGEVSVGGQVMSAEAAL
ncbi:MAG: aromatic amino acid lyase, partial [Woeseia sp.]